MALSCRDVAAIAGTQNAAVAKATAALARVYPALSVPVGRNRVLQACVIGRLRRGCRIKTGMGGRVIRHRLDQLRHAGIDLHAVGRLDLLQLRSRTAEPAGNRDLVLAAHDRDRQIVAIALEPELVVADAGAEVEL